jgi:hypothetical protein
VDESAARIAVFPWLDIPEAITVCGVTWYPKQAALKHAGDRVAHVDSATSYFYDHFRFGDPTLGVPLELSPVKPAVVFLDRTVTEDRVQRATNVLCFATIFANNPYAYTNSTTFEHFFQKIGGEPWVSARRTRRMHGSRLSGAMTQNLIETMPTWCGKYHAPHEQMLWALQRVVDRADAAPIREALEALMLATQDTDVVPASAEHAHYARALERLLHRPGQGRGRERWNAQRELSISLLAPLLSPLNDGTRDLYHIMEARYAASDKRNAFWHPEDAKPAKYAFEKQLAVAPNLIAFRASAALIIATIRALDVDALDDRLVTYLPTIEDWIGELRESDDRQPEDAADIGKAWSWRYHSRRIKRAVGSSPGSEA